MAAYKKVIRPIACYSGSELARLGNVSEYLVCRAIKAGELDVIRIGRRTWIRETDATEWLASRRAVSRPDGCLSQAEVAKAARCTAQAVSLAITEGRLDGVRVGWRVFVRDTDAAIWIATRRRRPK